MPLPFIEASHVAASLVGTGLLLLAPGMFPAVDLGWCAKLRVGLALVAGGRAQFDIPLNDPALFTDNLAGRQFIADDPLKLTRVTARFLYCSRHLDCELRRARARSLSAPITLALAGHDAIIRNGPTEAWVRRAAVQVPEVRTLTNTAHTLEFEPDVEVLENLLRRWAEPDRTWP